MNQEVVHHIPLRLPTEAGELRTADLLTFALQNNAAIDVIERLVTLQREEREYQARVAFDEALNRCQEQLQPISADASNPQTKSKYASYTKLDKVVRPIYTAEGFSVSYSEKDCPTPGKTRFVGLLSRGGITREYTKDLSPSTQGPKGNDVMTPIHADASADSYAKRYLLKDIFNIAIGENDNDGNGNKGATYTPMNPDRVRKLCSDLANAVDLNELLKRWQLAGGEAKKANDREALQGFRAAKDKRKGELTGVRS
jgi:hypothetical protein